MTFDEAMLATKTIVNDKQIIAAFGYDSAHNEYFCVTLEHNSDPDSLAYSLIYQGGQIPDTSLSVFTHEAEDTIECLKESSSFIQHDTLDFSIYDVCSAHIYEMDIEHIFMTVFPSSYKQVINFLNAA